MIIVLALLLCAAMFAFAVHAEQCSESQAEEADRAPVPSKGPVSAAASVQHLNHRVEELRAIHDLPVPRPVHPVYGQKPTYELTPDGWEELPQYEAYRQPVVVRSEPRLVTRGYEEYQPQECDHDTITIAALDGTTWHHPTCDCDPSRTP